MSRSRFVMLIGVTAVLFFLGLLPLEAIPEIPVDIDSKPFFIPLVLTALLPAGRPGFAIALGVALGEFLRDMMEGYELDDPIGFVGYAVAFALTSLLFGSQPPKRIVILAAGIFVGFVQAAIEASSFLLFGEESMGIVIQSTIGNTITHGIIWGAIPAFFLIPVLQGRFEHYLGFAPKGRVLERAPLTRETSGFTPAEGALAWIADVTFRYPSRSGPALEGVSLDLRPGEVLGLMGPSMSGKSTLCRILADVAPRATGGELIGEVSLGSHALDIGYVADNPAALMTRTRGLSEVEASLDYLELSRSEKEQRALATLAELGISEDEARHYIWELPVHRQLLIALAAAIAERPKLLILDEVGAALDASGLAALHRAIRQVRDAGGAVVLADNVAYRQAQWSDRIGVLVGGQFRQMGPTGETLADGALMAEAGLGIISQEPSKAAAGEEPDPVPILEVRDLHFSHDDGPQVWRGASFDLRRGEVLGIAGRNASGKTPLAKLLGGLLEPQEDNILFGGQKIEPGGDPGRIAVVMHDPSAFFSERTARAEIAFVLRTAQDDTVDAEQRITQVAELLGITPLLDEDPSFLPPGSARLLQIAAMLAREAPVLVLDEAALGMDPAERGRLLGAVREYVRSGGSAIVLDHNLDWLGAVSDRIMAIEEGALHDLGLPSAAFAADRRDMLAALDLEPPHSLDSGEAVSGEPPVK